MIFYHIIVTFGPHNVLKYYTHNGFFHSWWLQANKISKS